MDTIRSTFAAGFANESTVGDEIKRVYEEYQYLCDPHTAVAFQVLRQGEAAQQRPTVVLSTASPYKFCEKVLAALGQTIPSSPFEAMQKLQEISGEAAPVSLSQLAGKSPRFAETVTAEELPLVPLRMFPE